MKRSYQITGAVSLLVAVFFVRAALGLHYYTPLGPGPGFFPLWLSILLAILSVAMFWKATFGKPEAMPTDFYANLSGYLRIGAVVASLVGIIVLMEPLGFCLVMLVFYLFVLAVLGHQHPLVTVIIALIGSFGVYYVFVHWLATPLPIGLFGF